MGKGKGGGGENSKKAAGNARKAEAAAKKQAEVDAKVEAEEEEAWSQGAKGKAAKKEAEAAKREEIKRKKAEREQELEAETAEAAKKKPVINQKKAGAKPVSRGGGIDAALSASVGGGSEGELHAHNIDDAIAALELTTGKSSDKIDRHPERRFKSALRNYEERRLPEIKKEHPGLRLNQYQNRIFEEFKKSPENPFNQVNVAYNADREKLKDTLEGIKRTKEEKLKH